MLFVFMLHAPFFGDPRSLRAQQPLLHSRAVFSVGSARLSTAFLGLVLRAQTGLIKGSRGTRDPDFAPEWNRILVDIRHKASRFLP